MTEWMGSSDLVPAIVQDPDSRRVLMLAWMNEESFARTLDSGAVTFFSRSRQELWEKGSTSGNRLRMESMSWDCDGDTLLVQARPTGPVCHRDTVTCFDDIPLEPAFASLGTLWDVIADRARTRPEGSYTTELLTAGPEGPGRKVAEEGIELLLAAKDHATGAADDVRVAEEAADLVYHTLVLLAERGIDPTLVFDVLRDRRR
ncbi:MAG TPA: bifunctional phosphoribosyl-AMP cyclohydrolase/phosphoribosyl-ATP diphosphatase HisIE [Acidimicrobiia bacterium]|nr:bifunctional phosphoribosyl-AMP cyclohydrolase/phosphoribosyl-ATP diphosphatase HisIE [Acidimicrobiia bacterium]